MRIEGGEWKGELRNMMETATEWMRPREVGVDFWLGKWCTDHVRRCGRASDWGQLETPSPDPNPDRISSSRDG